MRVLVVGTVPPPGGAAAAELGRLAAARLDVGDDVTIWSPDVRSAAHATFNLSGLWLGANLALRASRFDALVLRIEAGVPCSPTTTRVGRGFALMALGAALRLYRDVTVYVDAPAPIPGGLGGRAAMPLWAQTNKIVVRSDEDLRQILAVPNIDADRIELELPVVATSVAVGDVWPLPTDDALRDRVLVIVRNRSRIAREINAARVVLAGGATPDDFSQSTQAQLSDIARVIARRVRSRMARARN